MSITDSEITIVVMAPLVPVCRHLSSLENIARHLPGIRSLLTADGELLTVQRLHGQAARIVPGRFRAYEQGRRIDWEINGLVHYSGTIRIYGDSGITQLRSVLRTPQHRLSRLAQDLHTQTLRSIADSVEAELSLPFTRKVPALPRATGIAVDNPGQRENAG